MNAIAKLRQAEAELLRRGGRERKLAELRAEIARLLPPIEYKRCGNTAYLVLRQRNGRTAVCPFCGERHTHGVMDHYAVAHCCTSGVTVTAPDGTELRQEDGYLLKEYDAG